MKTNTKAKTISKSRRAAKTPPVIREGIGEPAKSGKPIAADAGASPVHYTAELVAPCHPDHLKLFRELEQRSGLNMNVFLTHVVMVQIHCLNESCFFDSIADLQEDRSHLPLISFHTHPEVVRFVNKVSEALGYSVEAILGYCLNMEGNCYEELLREVHAADRTYKKASDGKMCSRFDIALSNLTGGWLKEAPLLCSMLSLSPPMLEHTGYDGVRRNYWDLLKYFSDKKPSSK